MTDTERKSIRLDDEIIDLRERARIWEAYLFDFLGGRSRTRTYDPLIKSQLLYHLSYAPAL